MFIKFNSLFSEFTINEIRSHGKKVIDESEIDYSAVFKNVSLWIEQINNLPKKKRKESVLESSFISNILVNSLGHCLVGSKERFSIIPKDGSDNFPDLKGGDFSSSSSYYNVKPKYLIELKGPNCLDFRKPQSSRPDKKSPAQQVISDMFLEDEECAFAVVTNMVDFEIFSRTFADKRSINFSLLDFKDYEDLFLLFGLLSHDSILSNPKAINLKFKKLETEKKNISKEFYRVFKDSREKLFKCALEKFEDDQSNYFVTKLLSQVIFIIYGESTGLIPRSSLANVLELGDYKWSNYQKFCMAMDKGGSVSQLSLFGYNGGLFYPSPLFRKKFGPEVLKSIKELAKFQFKDKKGDLLQVDDVRDILGRVLEFSLETNKEENLYNFTRDGSFAEARKKQATKNERQRKGSFYTKRHITKYMVERTITLLKNNGVNISKSKWLDPACGSGAFLVELFDQLTDYEKAKVGLKNTMIQNKESFKQILSQIESDVIDRVKGVDFDPLAAGISQLSISMKCCRPYEKLPSLSKTIYENDSLQEGVKKETFDVIVANPPYMRWEGIPRKYRDFLSKDEEFKDLAGIKADYSAFFFRDAYRKLKPGGFLTFIATNKLLSSAQAKDFRKWLTEKFQIVEVFDFRKAVFSGTDIETAIFILQKKKNVEEVNKPYRDIFNYNSSDNHLEPTQFSEVEFHHVEKSPFWNIPARTTPNVQRVMDWFYSSGETLTKIEDTFEAKTGLRITDLPKADVLTKTPKASIKRLYEPLHDGTSYQYGKKRPSQASRYVRKNCKKVTTWRQNFKGSNFILFKELSTKPVVMYSKNCPAILCSIVAFKKLDHIKDQIDYKSLVEYLNSPISDTQMEFWFGSNRTHQNQRWKKIYVNKVYYPNSFKLDDFPSWVLSECIDYRDGEFIDGISDKEYAKFLRKQAKEALKKSKAKNKKVEVS